jgi:hypothetical protein
MQYLSIFMLFRDHGGSKNLRRFLESLSMLDLRVLSVNWYRTLILSRYEFKKTKTLNYINTLSVTEKTERLSGVMRLLEL